MAFAVEQSPVAAFYAVGGMHCGSCARKVEAALSRVPGVIAAQVDPAARLATVTHGGTVSETALAMAVANAGYTLYAPHARPASRVPMRPLVFGMLAVVGLLTFYLGLITLAQGWEHAVGQLAADRWFVAAIALGFGTQVGLWSYLRSLHAQATAGGVAASTGMSGTAMLACCAHHLADILPIVGLSGAAILLNNYKTPLLWAGIVMNILGIVYLIRMIVEQRTVACQLGADAEHTMAKNVKTEEANEHVSI